ncbi:MAG TPA: MFS transporter [Pseudonocardia sp.]|nr:MFS transporter [Pseudonocardia sp.]
MDVRVRRLVLAGSFVAYLFDALEILLLSLALPAIRQSFQLSAVQGGLLATATLLGIGVSSVTAGWLADNYGRKRALTLSLAVFALFTVLIAVVPNFTVFLALRFLAGLGLGGVWGAVSTYAVESWPAESRGRAAAFILSSFPVGGMVAAVLSGLSLPDWRLMFLIAGLGALLPLAFVWRYFPESDEWLEQRAATGRDSRVRTGEVLTGALRRRTLLGTAVAGLTLTAWWGSSTWLPTYLHTDRGVSTAGVAVFLTVLNVGQFVGYNVFGLIADRIGRKNALIVSLVGVGLTLPLYAVATSQTLLLWLGPLFAFFGAFTGLFGSYLGELFPTRVRATGAGFCFNVGRGISAFAPLALGALAAGTGLAGGLLVCAACYLVAAGVMTVLPATGTRARDLDTAGPALPADTPSTDTPMTTERETR